jgi:hypothetical protein
MSDWYASLSFCRDDSSWLTRVSREAALAVASESLLRSSDNSFNISALLDRDNTFPEALLDERMVVTSIRE